MEGATKVVYFCPECGSASLEKSELVGGMAECKACSWTGTTDQLLASPVPEGYEEQHQLFMDMLRDLRRLLAHNAKDYGALLVKWGFADLQTGKKGYSLNPKQFARYMSAIGRAMLTALIEEHQKMEAEKHGAN